MCYQLSTQKFKRCHKLIIGRDAGSTVAGAACGTGGGAGGGCVGVIYYHIGYDAAGGGQVKALDEDLEETYEIVGSQEANPRMGRISDDSPVGRALHGARAGDVVTVVAPAGNIQLKVISVENK